MRILFSILFLITCIESYATIYQENLPANTLGNWSNPTSWLPVGVPGLNDSVVINDATIIVDVPNCKIKRITLQNSGRIKTNKQLTVLGKFYFKGGNSYGDSSIVVMDSFVMRDALPRIIRNRILVMGGGIWSGGNIGFTQDPDDGGEVTQDPDDGGEIAMFSNFLAFWNNTITNLNYTNQNDGNVFTIHGSNTFDIKGIGNVAGIGNTWGISTQSTTARVNLDCETSCGGGGGAGGDGNPDTGGGGSTGQTCQTNETTNTTQQWTSFYGILEIKKSKKLTISGGIDFKNGAQIIGGGIIEFKKAHVILKGTAISNNYSVDSMKIFNNTIVEGNTRIKSKRLGLISSTLRDSLNVEVDSLFQENSFMVGIGNTSILDHFVLAGTTGNTINRTIKTMGSGKWLSNKTSFAKKGKMVIDQGSTINLDLAGTTKEYSRGRGRVIEVLNGGAFQIDNSIPSLEAKMLNPTPGNGGLYVESGGYVAMRNNNGEFNGGGGGSTGSSGGINPPSSQTCDTNPNPVDTTKIRGILELFNQNAMLWGGIAKLDSTYEGKGSGSIGTQGDGDVTIKHNPNKPIQIIYMKEGRMNIEVSDTFSFVYLLNGHLTFHVDQKIGVFQMKNGTFTGSGNMKVQSTIIEGGTLSGSGNINTDILEMKNNSFTMLKQITLKNTGSIKMNFGQSPIFQANALGPCGKIIVDTFAVFNDSTGFDYMYQLFTSPNNGGILYDVYGTYNKKTNKSSIFQVTGGLKLRPTGTLNVNFGKLVIGAPNHLIQEGATNIANNAWLEHSGYNNISYASNSIISGGGRFVVNSQFSDTLTLLPGTGMINVDSIIVEGTSISRLLVQRPTTNTMYLQNTGTTTINAPITSRRIHTTGGTLNGTGDITANSFLCTLFGGFITGSGTLTVLDSSRIAAALTLGKQMTVQGTGPHSFRSFAWSRDGNGRLIVQNTTYSFSPTTSAVSINPNITLSATSTLNFNPFGSSNTTINHLGQSEFNGNINVVGKTTLVLNNPANNNIFNNANFQNPGLLGELNFNSYQQKFKGICTLNIRVLANQATLIDSSVGLDFIRLRANGVLFRGSGNTTISGSSKFYGIGSIFDAGSGTFTILAGANDTLQAGIELKNGKKYIIKGSTLWQLGNLTCNHLQDSFIVDQGGILTTKRFNSNPSSDEILSSNGRIILKGTFIKEDTKVKVSINNSTHSHLLFSGGTLQIKHHVLEYYPGNRKLGFGNIVLDTLTSFQIFGQRDTISSGISVTGSGFMTAMQNAHFEIENGCNFSARLKSLSNAFGCGILNRSVIFPKYLELEPTTSQFTNFVNFNKVTVQGKMKLGAKSNLCSIDTIAVQDSVFITGSGISSSITTITAPIKTTGHLVWNGVRVNAANTFSINLPNGSSQNFSASPHIEIIGKDFVCNAIPGGETTVFYPDILFRNGRLKKMNSNPNTLSGKTTSFGQFNIQPLAGHLIINTLPTITHKWAKDTIVNSGSGTFSTATGVKIDLENP